MNIELALLIIHIIGTIVGVGGATLIEVHLNQALKDKNISSDEREFLKLDYMIVRVGLILAILSGFGLLAYHRIMEHYGVMMNPIVWSKFVIVIIIAINTLLLQAKRINLYWGAAFSFVSWWAAAIFGVFITERVPIDIFGKGSFISSFGSVMLIYGVTVIVGAYILHRIRNKIAP